MSTATVTYPERLLSAAAERVRDLTADQSVKTGELPLSAIVRVRQFVTAVTVCGLLLAVAVIAVYGTYAPGLNHGAFWVLLGGALGGIVALTKTSPKTMILRHAHTLALWDAMRKARQTARMSPTATAKALREPLAALQEQMRTALITLEQALVDEATTVEGPYGAPSFVLDAADEQRRARVTAAQQTAKDAGSAALAATWAVQTNMALHPVSVPSDASATQIVNAMLLAGSWQHGQQVDAPVDITEASR